MAMTTGICRFCGQVRTVDIEEGENAEERATYECGCPEAIAERRKKDALIILDDTLTSTEEETGFPPLSQQGRMIVTEAAQHMLDRSIDLMTIDLEGRTVRLRPTKDAFVFSQTKKIEDSVEC